MNSERFSKWLQEKALQNGAHSAACIRMDNPLLIKRIKQNNILVADWLRREMHGEMNYLKRMFPKKADPWETFPFAKSVIVLAFTNSWSDPDAEHPFPKPENGALLGYISAYARGKDYHDAGKIILTEIKKGLGKGILAEIAVDTKAVYERIFATVAGLGVIGGNNLLRVPDQTNVRVFIGCLFVAAELPEVIREAKMPFACDNCLACIRKCPTKAIEFGKPINARRCISYLTIEKRNTLNREESEMIEDWLFGCDWCSVVCPPKERIDTRISVDLEWIFKTPAAQLQRLIQDSAVSYAGVTQLRKNSVVLLKKSRSPKAKALLDWVGQHTGSRVVRKQLTAW